MDDRILDATERLLGRFGYSKMTMSDIAAEAGIARRTVYLHFQSKEAVALRSIDRVVGRLIDRLREVADGRGTARDRLREMLVTRVMFRLDSVQGYFQSFHDLFAALRPAYMARRERYFAAEAAEFGRVLGEGSASGELVFDDADQTAATLIAATNSLLPYSLSPAELGSRADVQRQAERIAALLVAGLAGLYTDYRPKEGQK